MGPLDLLIIFVAVGVVAFLTYQRMARALFSLAILWAATMLSALLYKEAAYRIKAVTGPNRSITEGALFIGLFILFFIGGFLVFSLGVDYHSRFWTNTSGTFKIGISVLFGLVMVLLRRSEWGRAYWSAAFAFSPPR